MVYLALVCGTVAVICVARQFGKKESRIAKARVRARLANA